MVGGGSTFFPERNRRRAFRMQDAKWETEAKKLGIVPGVTVYPLLDEGQDFKVKEVKGSKVIVHPIVRGKVMTGIEKDFSFRALGVVPKS